MNSTSEAMPETSEADAALNVTIVPSSVPGYGRGTTQAKTCHVVPFISRCDLNRTSATEPYRACSGGAAAKFRPRTLFHHNVMLNS